MGTLGNLTLVTAVVRAFAWWTGSDCATPQYRSYTRNATQTIITCVLRDSSGSGRRVEL